MWLQDICRETAAGGVGIPLDNLQLSMHHDGQ